MKVLAAVAALLLCLGLFWRSSLVSERSIRPWLKERVTRDGMPAPFHSRDTTTFYVGHGWWSRTQLYPVQNPGVEVVPWPVVLDANVVLFLGNDGGARIVREGDLEAHPVCIDDALPEARLRVRETPFVGMFDCLESIVGPGSEPGYSRAYGFRLRRLDSAEHLVFEQRFTMEPAETFITDILFYDTLGTAYFVTLVSKGEKLDVFDGCALVAADGGGARRIATRRDLARVRDCYELNTWSGALGATGRTPYIEPKPTSARAETGSG
jgi:hypothetical protein